MWLSCFHTSRCRNVQCCISLKVAYLSHGITLWAHSVREKKITFDPSTTLHTHISHTRCTYPVTEAQLQIALPMHIYHCSHSVHATHSGYLCVARGSGIVRSCRDVGGEVGDWTQVCDRMHHCCGTTSALAAGACLNTVRR